MKIIHINTSLRNGGLENMMVDIANEQVLQGHTVSIIIINNGIESSIRNRISSKIRIDILNRQPGSKGLIKIVKLAYLLFKLRHYDIIHCHAAYVGKYLRMLSHLPRLLTIHALGYETKPLNDFNKIIAISHSVRADVESRSSFKPIVIYNGINTSLIKKALIAKKFNHLRIVQVSRLDHDEKGQDILLEALSILVNKNPQMNISIDFVGDGNSRNLLVSLAESLKLTNRVHFLGNKPREWIYKNLCDYDLFIQPSRYEGFGLTVAEAMAAKVPVIASDNDGPSEVLGYGKYGFLFKKNDATDLANQIQTVFKFINSDKLNTIVGEAYSYCLANFDIKQTSHNYIQEYNKTIIERRLTILS